MIDNTVYTPCVGDHVIGIVTGKTNDYYVLNINSAYCGILMAIDGFRGTTKKNKPVFNTGDVVLCEVYFIHNYNLIELTCINTDEFKSWTSYECYYDRLVNGACFNFDFTGLMSPLAPPEAVKLSARSTSEDSLPSARDKRPVNTPGENKKFVKNNLILFFKRSYALKLLKAQKFEMAIGFNNRIWIRSQDCTAPFKIARFLRLSLSLRSRPQVYALYTSLFGPEPSR